MASVYSRAKKSGGVTWYAKIKQPSGEWKPVALRGVTSKTAAKRLAQEIEQQQERATHGLEPGALFLGTFADLCAWAWRTHFKRLSGCQPDESRFRCHVGDPTAASPEPATWLGALPARHVTSHKLTEYLSEVADKPTVRGKPPSAGHVNRLRALFSSVFSLAIEHGKWAGPNPAEKTKARDQAETSHDILAADEIGPVLAEVSPYWRGVFAVGLLAGLRRGEIFALEHRDVDLVRMVIHVRRSHDSETTKGKRARTVPIHPDLLPYLEPWLALSGPILFPDAKGQRRSPNVHLELRLRAAMVRAGIIDHYDHKCRRKGCGVVEQHGDDAERDCPSCGFKLWPVARARHIRFHDTRHSFASHALMGGADVAAVQKVLGHRDPKLTTNTYGHLLSGYLADEVSRIQIPGLARTAANASEPEQVLPTSGEPCEPAAMVVHSGAGGRGAGLVRGTEPAMLAAAVGVMIGQETGTESKWSRRGSNSRPMHCESKAETFATFGPVRHGSQPGEIALAPTEAIRHGASPLDTVPVARGASLVHETRPAHQARQNAKAKGAGRIGAVTPPLVQRPGPANTEVTGALLTVAQVAERLSVSKDWVYRTVDKGGLAARRIAATRSIRIAEADLDAYLQRFPGIEPPAEPEPAAPPAPARETGAA